MGHWSPATVKEQPQDKNLLYTGMDESLEGQGKMGSSPKKSYRFSGGSGQTTAWQQQRQEKRGESLPWGYTGDSSCRNCISKTRERFWDTVEKYCLERRGQSPMACESLVVCDELVSHLRWSKSQGKPQGSVMNITGDKVMPPGKPLLSDT